MANNPELLKMPLARDGQKSTIPETTDASTGLFSQQYGWQSINSLPPQAGGKAVKREDFNGAFNLLGGIAFMAQKGFTFKWSADQDYYAGCVVIDDTDGLRYECIADVTANNTAPSADTTHWQIFSAGTDLDAWFRQTGTAYVVGDMRCYESLPYGWYLECTTAGTTGSGDITIPSPLTEKDTVTDGTVVWTIRKIGSGGDGFAVGDIKQIAYNGTIQDGWLECDGRAVSRTMFADLFAAIGTTYGAGDGSTTFNLPDYNAAERFVQGSTVAGTVKQAGLPNITGAFGMTDSANSAPNGNLMSNYLSGAFNNRDTGTASQISSGTAAANKPIGISFDASRSSAIYGNSTTVQPNALTARFVIKAYDGVTPTPSEADISQMLTELTGKANRQLSNLDTANLACHVVVDSYYDSTTGDWWREYDDGWIEQGGFSQHAQATGFANLNLLKPYSDANYTVVITSNVTAQPAGNASTNSVANKTTTGFQFCVSQQYLTGFNWIACGTGAQS